MASRLLVMQNLQQEARMDTNKNRAVWQRRLHFEDEQIWTELPESVKEHCRTLWRQLLASVLKTPERRQNERED
jgi:hypothetical protein